MWIEKCECLRDPHEDGCPNAPIFLVRMTVEDHHFKSQNTEVIRAVCSDCYFTDTPIIGLYRQESSFKEP